MASKEPKINPKLLNYDKTLPPFLARLQASQAGAGPSSYQSARPKKPRNAEDDAEDEPVYFDEGTNSTLTKAEWERAEKEREEKEGKFGGGSSGKDGEGENEDGRERGGSKGEEKAVIGVSRKRKLGKVIGGDVESHVNEHEEVEEEAKNGKKEVNSKDGKVVSLSSSSRDDVKSTKDASKTDVKKGEKPKTKKSKKVKLSFGDDE